MVILSFNMRIHSDVDLKSEMLIILQSYMPILKNNNKIQ